MQYKVRNKGRVTQAIETKVSSIIESETNLQDHVIFSQNQQQSTTLGGARPATHKKHVFMWLLKSKLEKGREREKSVQAH